MDSVKLRMLVEVEFDSAGISAEELGNDMLRVIHYGMGTGLFTGCSDATVEDWSARILKRRKRYDKRQKYCLRAAEAA